MAPAVEKALALYGCQQENKVALVETDRNENQVGMQLP